MSRLWFTASTSLVLACCLSLSCTRQPPPPPQEQVTTRPTPLPHDAEKAATRTAPLPQEVLQRVKSATALVHVRGGSGSGAWVGTLGGEALIVTNAHVLKNEGEAPPSHAELIFDTHLGVRAPRKARVLALDEDADLGLLAVEAPPDVQPLALGPSRWLEDGTALYVSGFPFGLLLGADGEQPSATINPGLSISLPFWGRTPAPFQPLLAGINPGNSGGPVVDAQGRLRGVAVAHVRGTEASFMVPAEEIRHFISASQPGARYTWEEAPTPLSLRTLPEEPANLKELLRSTVRVRAGSNSSGGFVIGSRGEELLVLCNRHVVVDKFSLPLGKIEVSTIGEDGRERKGSAELLRSEASEDLALLQVKDLPALPALVMDDGEELAETDPIWVLGLSQPDAQRRSRPEPLRGVVSGKRYDRGVELALLQVDIGVNAENTGGPVVDARGRVVGLAVWRHPKTNVSVVIPGLRLKDLLAGALKGGLLILSHDGVDRCLIDLQVAVDDPLHNLVKTGLVVLSPDAAVYMPDGDRTVMEVGPTVRTAPLESGGARLRAVLDPCDPGERSFQVWVERANGKHQVSRPFTTQVTRRSAILFRGSYQPGDEPPILPVPMEYTGPIPGWTGTRCDREDGRGCREACANPAMEAMNCVTAGDLAFDGRGGLARDKEEARRQYAKACEAEEVEGCERLLRLFPPGTRARPTPEAVLALHHRMCELGRLTSCLAETLPIWQVGRTPEELSRAVVAFDRACEGGEPQSCILLGVAHETGAASTKRIRARPSTTTTGPATPGCTWAATTWPC